MPKNYKRKYYKLLSEVGILRQLVAEVTMTQDQIYKELDKIAPLMTEKQRSELRVHLEAIFKDFTTLNKK